MPFILWIPTLGCPLIEITSIAWHLPQEGTAAQEAAAGTLSALKTAAEGAAAAVHGDTTQEKQHKLLLMSFCDTVFWFFKDWFYRNNDLGTQ